MKLFDSIIDYFYHKKKWHKAYDCLPHYNREVVVQRSDKSIPPFMAYLRSEERLSCKNGNIFWVGTCGIKKDKIEFINSDDEWIYYENF